LCHQFIEKLVNFDAAAVFSRISFIVSGDAGFWGQQLLLTG